MFFCIIFSRVCLCITTINDMTLKNLEKVIKLNKTVVVYFSADWCTHCKVVSPIIDELIKTQKDINFVKLNVDKNESIVDTFSLTSIPCIIIFENGAEKDRIVGNITKEELENRIK
jgi:thioredoxin 1